MNLQPSTNQKVFVITISLILFIGMFWGATQIVGKQPGSRQQACEQVQQYQVTSPVANRTGTLDDTLCAD